MATWAVLYMYSCRPFIRTLLTHITTGPSDPDGSPLLNMCWAIIYIYILLLLYISVELGGRATRRQPEHRSARLSLTSSGAVPAFMMMVRERQS